jgi:hypothetical protein
MTRPSGRAARLICLFLLGLVLFNYPVLAIFNVSDHVFGVPTLYAYVFFAWLVVIALAAAALRDVD